MVEFYNKTDKKVDFKGLEEVVKFLTNRPVEVLIVSDSEIEELNRQFRGKPYPTDVLSFPLTYVAGGPLGSVVISIDRAEWEAKKRGHSVADEIKLLLIHGILHLLGYDHEVDKGEMELKEREIIEKLKLPTSLIDRNLTD